jgi:PAS domain S-box-containing protein
MICADHDKIVESLALSPIAMVLSNPLREDNPLELVNPAFCTLTGYSEGEVLGRNCRFLAGKATDQTATDELRKAIRSRHPVLTEILNYRRDGTPFRNGVMIAPIYDGNGELRWFLGSQLDLGSSPFQSFSERRLNAAKLVDELPPRQREVLRAMAQGLLNKQIAWELKISEKTVKMHRALLLERLGVATSAEAIRIAVEAGF